VNEVERWIDWESFSFFYLIHCLDYFGFHFNNGVLNNPGNVARRLNLKE